MGTKAYIPEPRNCDLCAASGVQREAKYDAKTLTGPWAYMCEQHFQTDSLGQVGTGWGQELVVGEEPQPTRAERRQALLDAAERGDLAAMEDAVGDGDVTDLL